VGTKRLATLGTSAALTGAILIAAGCGDDSGTQTSATAEPVGAVPAAAPAPKSAAGRAGRKGCAGKSPRALERDLLRRARRDASPAERAFVRNVARNRAELRRGDTYPQVVARLYATSLPRGQRRDGYLGCAHELQ
jgi:hypothetical protein